MTGTRSIWDKNIQPEKNPYFWQGNPIIKLSDNNIQRNAITMIDLFCGCGGFSVGFEWAGFTPILGVDIHPQSISTYKACHKYSSTILGDMRLVSQKTLLDAVCGHHVTVIAAGVPCQGFSLCNRKRHANDERNFLFKEFIRCVKLFKPEFVLLENVSGLVSTANGTFKHDISSAIEECGYNVDCNLLNAIDYGVPQKRQRIFFQGAKKGKYRIIWPAPTHGTNKGKYINVWDAIGDLPPLKSGESKTKYDRLPFTDYQKRLRGNCNILLNHAAPQHEPEVVEKIANTKPGQPLYPKFKQRIRLDQNQPSPTQVSGGIRPQFQFGHPTQARGLTIRERCRIQSFPDDIEIYGGIVQGRIQTGNAVPPLLANAIARQIIKSINHDFNKEEILPAKALQMGMWSKKEPYLENKKK